MKKQNLDLLAKIFRTAKTQGSMGKVDFIASRLKIASQESTMIGVVNKLLEILNIEKTFLKTETVREFLYQSDADCDLFTIREYPDIVAIVGCMSDDERELAADSIPCVNAASGGCARPRTNFDIPMSVTLHSPLIHGGDVKSGNTTLFRRMDVVTDSGILTLPYYAGNALRGLMRRELGVDLARRMGYEWSNSKPPFKLWFYYLITSGGSIGEKDKDDCDASLVGKGGTLNIDGIRKFRELLPGISALGGCLGGKIIPGMVMVNDLRPCCLEWGTGTQSVHRMTEYNFLIRHDDLENPAEYAGMIANTEVVKAGTVLEGGIDFQPHASELEKSAAVYALNLVKSKGYIGAMNRAGFGKCELSFESKFDGLYDTFMTSHLDEIREFLTVINALVEA